MVSMKQRADILAAQVPKADRDRLRALVGLIASIDGKVEGLKLTIRDAKEQRDRDVTRAELVFRLLDPKDPATLERLDGLVMSNAEDRKLGLAMVINEDPVVTNQRAAIRSLEGEMVGRETEAKMLHREFRALEALMRLSAAQAIFLAGGD